MIDIEKNICAQRELYKGKLILAVSGGADSMVLLHLLYKLKLGNELIVAHFEHGIRGEESKEDARFVQEEVRRLGLPFFMRAEDILAQCKSGNLESVARERRYAFLIELLEKEKADYILTAHHADDNLETILMNLVRGCGPAGLAGMQYQTGVVLRPLLEVSKEQILLYARENDVAFREDSTNEDAAYTRNRLRLEVLPILKEMNPGVVYNVSHTARLLSLDNDYLDEQVKNSGCVITKEYGFDLLPEKEAILGRAIYSCLRNLLGREVQAWMIQDVLLLFTLQTGKRKKLSHDITAYRTYDGISLVITREKILESYSIAGSGTTDTPFGSFTVETVTKMEKLQPDSNIVYYQGAGELTVRSRRQGDYFIPFGHQKEQKLKDYLIDNKVPVFLRDQLPLLCLNGRILALPGVGRSDLFKVEKRPLSKVTFCGKKN